MSASRRSMPQTSRPTTAAARAAHVGHVVVHQVGDVPAGSAGGQVRVPAQRYDLARGPAPTPGPAPAPARCASALSSSLILVSAREWPSPRRGSALTRATSLADVGGAVAGHRGRAQLGRGHHLAVDDQHPVVRAGHERLHDRAGRAGRRPGVGLGRVGGGGHADGHVDAVVAVARLDHQRAAEPVQRLRGLLPRSRPRRPRAPGCPRPPAAAWPASCRPRCRPRSPRSARSARRRPAGGGGRSRAAACSDRRPGGPVCPGGGPRPRGRRCSRRAVPAPRPG